MENQYVCRFDIDFRLGDIEIKLNGDGQEVLFKFMIAFFSFPSLLFFLLQLWNGKMNKTEISSFGFAVRYYFTVEDEDLLIEHSTYHELIEHSTYYEGEYITRNYKFNFENFVKAIDKGFSEYLQEQRSKGIPIGVEEDSHPLSKQVIKEYEEFSTIINEKKGKYFN
ncbi:hypothetical protein MKZ20_11145 [Psychrobacillus sp. FSL K6-2684]|uniref:hypothetical protein n=1 Tax=unclassified Psychrobacillus TaxID=2636677 RepID=UPI0012488C91|nr:hypothetical protein [Psychrobacillus sp. AK 1817]QEY19464.1 hypothetical protein D0S48_01410 [Psychrobacillus sp. AK 1817]